MPDERRGASLLEVVIIALLLGIVSIPLLQSFGSFSRSMHRSTRHTRAIYLAQSVLEQIRARAFVSRDLLGELESLAEDSRQVVDQGGSASRFFLRFENLQGSDLHGITEETDPDLFQQLSLYRCEVQVQTGSSVPLDTGSAEAAEDIVEVGVTIRWPNPKGGERSITLWTVLTSMREGRGI